MWGPCRCLRIAHGASDDLLRADKRRLIWPKQLLNFPPLVCVGGHTFVVNNVRVTKLMMMSTCKSKMACMRIELNNTSEPHFTTVSRRLLKV